MIDKITIVYWKVKKNGRSKQKFGYGRDKKRSTLGTILKITENYHRNVTCINAHNKPQTHNKESVIF